MIRLISNIMFYAKLLLEKDALLTPRELEVLIRIKMSLENICINHGIDVNEEVPE